MLPLAGEGRLVQVRTSRPRGMHAADSGWMCGSVHAEVMCICLGAMQGLMVACMAHFFAFYLKVIACCWLPVDKAVSQYVRSS